MSDLDKATVEPDNSGPASPVQGFTANASGSLDGQFVKSPGKSLLDWFAGQEQLADCDNVTTKICVALAGPMPEGGYSTGDIISMLKWDSKWRAALKYIRAEAMVSEHDKRSPNGK